MPKVVDTPSDPGIPTLAAALDPAELARRLGETLNWDTSQGIRVRVLRWKPASRCTFEVAVRSATGWQELIGKVYAEDRSDVYRTMDELRRAGFDDDAEFGIPRPLAFVTPLRLLLYEKAPGARARKVIVESDGPEPADAAARCARWLAWFHAHAPRLAPVMRLDDHMRELEHAWQGLARLGPPFADKASRLFRKLEAMARGLGDGDLCAGHGTYSPGQVLLAEGRTVTIDWDTYHVADPSHDVARFLVELKRMGLKYSGSTHALDAVSASFLETYLATSRSDVMTRLPFQEAAICLDRAKHDADKQATGRAEKAEAMLNEGLRVLG